MSPLSMAMQARCTQSWAPSESTIHSSLGIWLTMRANRRQKLSADSFGPRRNFVAATNSDATLIGADINDPLH